MAHEKINVQGCSVKGSQLCGTNSAARSPVAGENCPDDANACYLLQQSTGLPVLGPVIGVTLLFAGLAGARRVAGDGI